VRAPIHVFKDGVFQYDLLTNAQFITGVDVGIWNSNDDLALLASLADKIRGHSFNAGIFLAEGHQSLNTIVAGTKAFFGVLTNVQRGNFAGAARALAQFSNEKAPKRISHMDIPNAWLALRYGWEPLIKDIYEAATAYSALQDPPRTIVFRVRKTKYLKNVEASVSPSTYPMPTACRSTHAWKYTLTEQVSQARSLGLLDPASIVWEKLPYSFVVDWFIPIGNYLSVLGMAPAMSGTGLKTIFDCGETSLGPYIPFDQHWSGSGGSYKGVNIRLSRSNALPSSVPYPSTKTIAKALSLAHIQNAAALVWSLIGSAKRNS